jgi:hypothetical protein
LYPFAAPLKVPFSGDIDRVDLSAAFYMIISP